MAEKGPNIELTALLHLDRREDLREALEQIPVQDIAEAMTHMGPEERLQVLHLLPDDRRTHTFSYLSHGHQMELLEALETREARRILRELLPDDRTALLESLSSDELEQVLKLLDAEDLKQTLKLLGYPEESAGRLMTTRFVSVSPQWTVARALDHIRHEANRGEIETVNFVFVTDERGKLLDSLRLKEFILARQNVKVESLIDGDVISVQAADDREEAVRIIQHYDLPTVPVTDRNGVLLGIVTVDDIMDVAEMEFTEDFHKLGATAAVSVSIREASPRLLYRKRIGWLVILVFVNLISGVALSVFEEAIETVVALVFFLPLIIASAGNAGSQSATLMVRALATGDVEKGDWLRMWSKELVVALSLGGTMGVVVSFVGIWRGGYDLALAVAVAMACVVVMGAMVGMLLPFILERFNVDPATASAPLITSVADVLGILIYFSIAVAILNL